jgi:hypothetical protein
LTSGVGFGGVTLAGKRGGVEIGFGASWFDGGCGVEVGFGVTRFVGLGTFRFGGIPFGPLGDPPGIFALGDWFGPGEPAGDGCVAGPDGDPAGLRLNRFGGEGFFPEAGALGAGPGGIFAFGEVGPGFIGLGGGFCPGPGVGEPGATSDSVALLLPICGFTKGVGFGRPLGWGFCSAMVFLSFSAFWDFSPCHPFSTTGFTIRFCTDGRCAARALRVAGGAIRFSWLPCRV